MDIQQLRLFNAVVHLENISKAADSLHISQSALSKQIHRLENELGVPLFDRKGKRVILNRAGMRFYDSSRQVLQELQSAADDLQMMISGKNPRIRIGSSAMPAEMLECIGAFSDLHPQAHFVLNGRIDFEENIDINQYDALICPEEYRFEHLNGYPLCNESYYFAVNRHSELADEKAFSFSVIKNLPLVFLQGTNLSVEFPYKICSSTEFEPGPLFFTDTRQVHRWMIAAGRASGFVPRTESASYKADPDIVLLRILDPRFIRPMKICFLRESHLSELGLLFRDFTASYFNLDLTSAK